MATEEIDKLTHKIIGCAMEVHNQLGNGFQEVIYQRSLAIELGLQGIAFERELEMDLLYKNENVGTRRVDFFVEGLVMVEIKAIEKLEGVHKAQAINYCEAYNLADGLLINFGAERLQYHRVFNKKLKAV
jgi:GxxExxY protein